MNRLLAPFVLFGFCLLSHPAYAAAILDQLEASVNGALVLKSDIDRFKKNLPLRSQVDPLFLSTSVGQKGAKATDSEIIDYLIDEKLILSAFPVTDAETEQSINLIQSENKLSRGSLKDMLKDQGYPYEDYFELIRMSVSKKNLVDADIRTKVSVSDDDVKNFYFNRYAKDSKTPRVYSFKMVTVTPSDYKSPALAKESLERARKDILAGESLDDVAKRLSPGGAAPDVARLSEDQMTPAIKDAVVRLKIGEMSALLGSADSFFYFVKLLDVSVDDLDRFQKMKEEIRGQLATTEYQRQIVLWLERQRQAAYIRKAAVG